MTQLHAPPPPPHLCCPPLPSLLISSHSSRSCNQQTPGDGRGGVAEEDDLSSCHVKISVQYCSLGGCIPPPLVSVSYSSPPPLLSALRRLAWQAAEVQASMCSHVPMLHETSAYTSAAPSPRGFIPCCCCFYSFHATVILAAVALARSLPTQPAEGACMSAFPRAASSVDAVSPVRTRSSGGPSVESL